MKNKNLALSLFRVVVYSLSALIPLWNTIVWGFLSSMPEWVVSPSDLSIVTSIDNHDFKFLAWLVGVPANFTWIYLCITFANILGNYKKNKIFVYENAKAYNMIGYLICAYLFLTWIANIAINIIFSVHSSLIHNILEELDFSYLIGFVLGFSIILIGWVMKEAHTISEEQQSIV